MSAEHHHTTTLASGIQQHEQSQGEQEREREREEIGERLMLLWCVCESECGGKKEAVLVVLSSTLDGVCVCAFSFLSST